MTKPRVWCSFTVKFEDSDLKLRIQDAPSDRIEDVSYLFAEHFMPEETFHKKAGVHKNKEALEECREFIKGMMEDSSVVICCEDDGDSNTVGELIAAGIMAISRRGDPEEEFDVKPKTKELETMFQMMCTVFEMYDPMKQMEDLDSLYDDRGLVVHPKYRGLGLAQKMFHVRRQICKEEGISMTGAWMTGAGSQKAAHRDGWETAFEISYEEIAKLFDITFEGSAELCKYMIAKSL